MKKQKSIMIKLNKYTLSNQEKIALKIVAYTIDYVLSMKNKANMMKPQKYIRNPKELE